VGALYVRQGTPIAPIGHGGPQERNLRPGTENVPGIVGLGAALGLVARTREAERARLENLRRRLVARLAEVVPASACNVPPEASAPHVLSVSFPGANGEMLLFLLDQRGIAASMGSACNAGEIAPSHVLQALGLAPDRIEATLRFSMGQETTEEDVDYLLEVLPQAVASASG
jgi:cysteine desulfurase